MTIATFYPSLDGLVYHDGSDTGDTSWAALIAGAGTHADTTVLDMHISCYAISPVRYDRCHRSIVLFDTSSLGAGADISAATLSLYGYDKWDTAGKAPNVNIYSSSPASNSVLAAGDYDSLGSTPFSTAITYAGFNTSGYNDFILNADGVAAINKTGISKFGVRNANYDVAAIDPGYTTVDNAQMRIYTVEQGGNFRPKLVVTYFTPQMFYF